MTDEALDGGRFDWIVVGTGSAGSVLAARLSERSRDRVLVLEAGGLDRNPFIHIPAGYTRTLNSGAVNWRFEIDPEDYTHNRPMPLPRGKVVGGSSSINGMLYVRGNARDFDDWAQMGNRGWSWDEVLPVFKRSEDYQHGANAWHGEGGELRVEERRVDWEILDAWRAAAAECGIAPIDEFNRGDNSGCAYFQMTQRRGRRCSAVRAFLDPVRQRPNLTIMTDSLVEHIDFKDREARGLRVRTPSGRLRLRARREVLLAAGAIGSPHLLQRSGVGPGALLAEHGVPLVLDVPGVGENLHDHLQIRSIWRVHNTRTLNQRAGSLFGKAAMAIEYLLRRTGPLTMPPSQLGAFAASDAEQPAANLQWHVQPLSLDAFGQPLHPFNAITPSVCNLRPTSRGHVRLSHPSPDRAPLIRPNYLATEADRRVAVAGLRYTRRIMAAQALARFSPTELKPGPEATSDADLMLAAQALGTTIFHAVGTCKMGLDPMAVVDDRLRVRGIRRLRVIDASIMPHITSGNTNAPTVMIAEQGARFIQADLRRDSRLAISSRRGSLG